MQLSIEDDQTHHNNKMVKPVHKSFPVRKACDKTLNAILEISRKVVIILYDDTKIQSLAI